MTDSGQRACVENVAAPEATRAPGQADPYMTAWTAYVDHVHPRTEERPPCPVCVGVASPTAGCEEGQRLYGAYRLARIE
jgi:hypothetical protein